MARMKEMPHERRQDQTQQRARPDAQRRRHHGCDDAGTGARGGEGRCVRGHGARTHPRGHPRGRRRLAHERSRDDQGNPEGREHSRHGQGPHRPFRGSADPPSHRYRLHRRIGGPLACRRCLPHRQDRVRRSVRLRGARPRRGAAPHSRGRDDDPYEGRTGHRRRRAGRTSHEAHQLPDQACAVVA